MHFAFNVAELVETSTWLFYFSLGTLFGVAFAFGERFLASAQGVCGKGETNVQF